MIPADADFWTEDDWAMMPLLWPGVVFNKGASVLFKTWVEIAPFVEPHVRANNPIRYSLYDACHLESLKSESFTTATLARWYKDAGDP